MNLKWFALCIAAFLSMTYICPMLADEGEIMACVVIGLICIITMVVCLRFGDLSNIAHQERKNKEEQ